MNLYFSTNAINFNEFSRIHEYLDEFDGKVGVELFPEPDKEGFEKYIEAEKAYLMTVPFSLHGPYYESEYACDRESVQFKHSMELLNKTLEAIKGLHPNYMVYHHCNSHMDDETRPEFLKYARANYKYLNVYVGCYGIDLAVENVTLTAYDKTLFDEDAFIEECKNLNCKVLIDIGHVNASGWDLHHVIYELQDQIISYHVHNNGGYEDDHRRIFDGTIDFDEFLDDYMRYTPDADIVFEYCKEAGADVEGVKDDFRYVIDYLDRNAVPEMLILQ